MRNRLPVLLVILTLLAGLGASPAPAPSWQSKVDPALLEGGGLHSFLVVLDEQADLSGAGSLPSKAEKGRYVYRRLVAHAARSQAGLLSWLERRGLEYRAYWISNAVWVQGDAAAIETLARRPEVSRVSADPWVEGEKLTPAEPFSPAAQASLPWNIDKVRAPRVWAQGFTGQGVVIGGQDTGYEWDHPALRESYRGWDGSRADHNYNWHDAIHADDPGVQEDPAACDFDNPAPCDDKGHGTHTMGIMTGVDPEEGRQIGMAPGAKWIGCRNMKQGFGRPSTYLECFQWFLAPTGLNGEDPRPELAPDIINNSWGCPDWEGCTEPDVLKAAVDAVHAAGILTVQSAGNDASNSQSERICSSVHDPAAIYERSFTVGNSMMDDRISPDSSRGPVLADGSGRLKPDIVAPGTQVISSYLGGSYMPLSGTSMASPHVSGLAALLISANPALAGQPAALRRIIERSALPLPTEESCGDTQGQVPNNVSGWGRIDAWKAFLSANLEVDKTASTQSLAPGEIVTYTLSLKHRGIYPVAGPLAFTDLLPEPLEFVSASQSFTRDARLVTWAVPGLAPGETWEATLSARVPGDFPGGVIVNDQYGLHADTTLPLSGLPVRVLVGELIWMPLIVQ